MGMFDTIIVLDETLRCPHGHRVEDFQTKSFTDPSMDTYLVEGPCVYHVGRGAFGDSDHDAAHWLVEGNEAVFQRRHAADLIVPPRDLLFYTSCDECAPVLVRRDRPGLWGDLIDERRLWVEFRGTFGPEGERHIERTSGTRDDLVIELRGDGLRVMRDDEPLAIAHREICAARVAMPPGRNRAGR